MSSGLTLRWSRTSTCCVTPRPCFVFGRHTTRGWHPCWRGGPLCTGCLFLFLSLFFMLFFLATLESPLIRSRCFRAPQPVCFLRCREPGHRAGWSRPWLCTQSCQTSRGHDEARPLQSGSSSALFKPFLSSSASYRTCKYHRFFFPPSFYFINTELFINFFPSFRK